MVDPVTGEVQDAQGVPYADHSGVLAAGGGIVGHRLLDGTIVAIDDETLDELWKINVGAGWSRRR